MIRDQVAFNKVWPEMESYFHFLLRWHKIKEDHGTGWLNNYLAFFNAYIHLGVGFGNLEALDFCTPNIEKSSKEEFYFEFPPCFKLENPNDIAEVIMVF